MPSVFQPGNTAVITGGASGIGLALARRCAGHGMRVLVVDRDAERLGAVRDGVAGADTFQMDVGRPEDWARLKEKVDRDFGGQIHLLALNAGVGPKSGWDDAASFRAIFDTNLYGVVHGVSTFLGAVRTAASASAGAASASAGAASAVVITGSKQGITNPPGNPAYNASKSAVKTLAEHLSFDLRNDANVEVHLLVPGWTFTGLTGGRPGVDKPEGAWWPDQVVDYLQQKMAEGKFYILCPDNDVSEDTDKRRMLWSVGDVIEGRPPLTRWRDEWKEEAQEWMANQKV